MHLFLVENFSQLPATAPEIRVSYAIFESPKGQKIRINTTLENMLLSKLIYYVQTISCVYFYRSSGDTDTDTDTDLFNIQGLCLLNDSQVPGIRVSSANALPVNSK